MPRILILADHYVPNFAPRMGYLVKNLSNTGYEFDILTGPDDGDIRYQSLVGNEKVIRCSLNKIKTSDSFLTNFYFTILRIPIFYANSKQYIQTANKHLNPSDYQLILCSTAFSLPVLQAARIIAKKWDKPWIADIRDLHEQMSYNKNRSIKNNILRYLNTPFSKHLIHLRNKNLRLATKITTVSPFNKDLLQKLNPNTSLICNGYDPDTFYPGATRKQEIFKLVYTGILIDYCSDLNIFFQSIHQLYSDGKISPDTFSICFYIPEWCRTSIRSNKYYDDIAAFISFRDHVNTSAIPKILHEASILLLFVKSVHSNRSQGIIPTKYFEYLAMERPVLLTPGDDAYLDESLIASGEGVPAKNVDAAMDFIYKKYQEWKQKGFTQQKVNQDYVKQFSRKKQALQFQEIFEKLI